MAISFSVSLLLMALITTTSLRLISTSETPLPHQPHSLPLKQSPPAPPASTTQTPPLPTPAEIQEKQLIITTSLRLISTSETPPPPKPRSLHVKPPPPPPPPPPPTPAEIQEKQLKNILDALIGAGDFAGWANVLSSADPSAFPLTATLFIPSNDATPHLASATATGIPIDPFLIPYHIVPQRLTFSDLQHFSTHSRLPTLLPSKYIVITNNSRSNFTVDDSQITQADVFLNVPFSVHGINKMLDYSVYGSGSLPSPPPQENTNPRWPKPTIEPPKKRNPVFPGEITVGISSGASCLCSWTLMILSTLIAVSFIQDSLKFARSDSS